MLDPHGLALGKVLLYRRKTLYPSTPIHHTHTASAFNQSRNKHITRPMMVEPMGSMVRLVF